jgi:hypothetical protein
MGGGLDFLGERGAVIETGAGRSRPSPKPGFMGTEGICLGYAALIMDDEESIVGRLPSESEASMDPRASSTSGKDMIDDTEDDVDMDCSEGGIDLCDDREGRDGYDSNGGE